MIDTKIKNIGQLKKIVRRYKLKDKKIIFTNGCFDILHYGHVKYLEKAKKKGDILIVGVNSDNSIKKIKGKQRPIMPERARAGVISGLESVDFVIIFKQTTPFRLIKNLKPDILVKGRDWQKKEIIGSGIVKAYKGKVITIPYINNYSTSKIIKRIVNKFR